MDPERTDIFAEDFSVEEFDIDFEFDAPRFYDFSKPELYSETEETELWFESAGNYPPSPFSLKLSWRYDDEHLEIPKPISDKYNGFIYYNQAAKDVPKTTHKSKTKPFLRKNSTLTRPTASLLARQNQKPLDIYSVRLLTRCQRSLGKLEDKFSSLLYSMPQTQDNKRQKLETGFLRKVSRLDQTPFVHKVPRKGSKVTVPKEPNLKTAQRATSHRFKAKSAPEQIAKFSSTMYKTFQETSSPFLPKKNTPRPQDFQAFHLRTSLRARERSSSAKNAPTDDRINSLTPKSVGYRKGRRVKESLRSKTNCQVYESKVCPLDSKTSSKCAEAIDLEHENSFLRVSHSYCRNLKLQRTQFFEMNPLLNLSENYVSLQILIESGTFRLVAPLTLLYLHLHRDFASHICTKLDIAMKKSESVNGKEILHVYRIHQEIPSLLKIHTGLKPWHICS